MQEFSQKNWLPIKIDSQFNYNFEILEVITDNAICILTPTRCRFIVIYRSSMDIDFAGSSIIVKYIIARYRWNLRVTIDTI